MNDSNSNDLNFTAMLEMQHKLWERYKDSWSPLEPDYARNSLLWMMGELGEVIDVIKKKGEKEIIANEKLRGVFVEELCDVLMYFNDVLLRYGVTPEEMAQAYVAKHNKNMKRDYNAEREKFLND